MKAALRSPLLWTFVVAVLLLVGVGGWLLADPATSRSDALKTGGLAGSAVVALYALWLNDRRRKVEEGRQATERDRHDLELARTEHDRERISDERFAKSVELLGHAADQVRVGALHALAGLARSRPGYTQTVLDVVCSYLRRPFSRQGEAPEGERELQVRLTAQRVIAAMLPRTALSDARGYELDLTGATLEDLDLSGRRIGGLLLRDSSLQGTTNLSGCAFGNAWFSGAKFAESADFTETVFDGETTFKDAIFAKDALFEKAVPDGSLDFTRTRFEGHTDLRFVRTPGSVTLKNTLVRKEKVPLLPEGWQRETTSGGVARIVPDALS